MKSFVLGSAAALMVLAGAANAQTVNLADRNSNVTVNLNSSAGMSSWSVDGTNQLFQQWFWYRVGNTDEAPLNSLGLQGFVTSNTNFDPADDTVFASYSNGSLRADITFGLQGGSNGSGQSDILEQIVLINVGSTPLDLHFFQYSDFDLGGTAGGDTVFIPNGNLAQQSDSAGTAFNETVVTPAANHWQVSSFATVRNLFSDGLPTTLNDFGGPLTGDMTWAFEWDINLLPGDSFVISKDKLITPAPGAFALLGLGGLVAGRRRR